MQLSTLVLVFASVISRFRKHVLICQRTARAYLKCRKCRLDALRKWFLSSETKWINLWRLKKKVDEIENKAMTTHAPKNVRDGILLNYLNTEMFKYRAKLIEHDKRVKESVAMVKQVGINDARAVIQGQVHFLERKKLVLKRPFHGIFTGLSENNGMMGLVKDAHDRMNVFQNELGRDVGIALLGKADEVLWDLQDEIEQYGDTSLLYKSSSEEEESDDDGLYDTDKLVMRGRMSSIGLKKNVGGEGGGEGFGGGRDVLRRRTRTRSRTRTFSGTGMIENGELKSYASGAGKARKRTNLAEGGGKHRPTNAQIQEIEAMRRRMTSAMNDNIDFNRMV